MSSKSNWLLARGSRPVFDTRILIHPGDCGQHWRKFPTLIKRNAKLNSQPSKRLDLVKTLTASLRTRNTSDFKSHCECLVAFFSWADSKGVSLSAETSISALHLFSQEIPKSRTSAHLTLLQSIFSEALDIRLFEFQNMLRGVTDSNWIISVEQGTGRRRISQDLRCLVAPDFVMMQPRRFLLISEKEKEAALLVDPPRTQFVIDFRNSFVTAISSSRRTDGFPGEVSSMKKLIRFMDDNSIAISRTSVYELLSRTENNPFDSYSTSHAWSLIRCLTWMSVTDVEKQVTDGLKKWRSLVKQNSNTNDESWEIQLPEANHPSLDLRYLVRAGDAALGHRSFRKIPEPERLKLLDGSPRQQIIEEFKTICIEEISFGTSQSTVLGLIMTFARFLKWCDTQKFLITKENLSSCLSSFVLNAKARVTAGNLKLSSIIHDKAVLSRIVSKLLDVSLRYVQSQLPSVEKPELSGRSGTYVSSEDVEQFTQWLGLIVGAVTLEVIDSARPEGITIENGNKALTIPGSKSISKFLHHRFFNIILIQARIEAELLRFISLTGANLGPVLTLRIGEIDWTATPGGYLIKKFKGRKGGDIDLIVPKTYRSILLRHIDFIRELLPGANQDESDRVFPMLTSEPQSRLINMLLTGTPLQFKYCGFTSNALVLKQIFRQSDIQFHSARTLRYALADWNMNASDGDALRVSRLLGNTPRIAYSFYGGHGNLPKAKREMTKFWSSFRTKMALSIAPGLCNDSTKPLPIPTVSHTPKCGSENACFFCSQYRGIDSLDYVKLIISRLEELRIRTLLEPSRTDEYRFIAVELENIVLAFCERNPNLQLTVQEVRDRVYHADYHPYLQGNIELLRIIHGI